MGWKDVLGAGIEFPRDLPADTELADGCSETPIRVERARVLGAWDSGAKSPAQP